MKTFNIILLAGLVACPAIATAVPITIVSQADTWRYNFGASLGSGVSNLTLPNFTANYSGVSTGQAAFGNRNAPGGPVNTTWFANRALYLQKTVNLSGNLTSDATLNVAVDNGAAIWINGNLAFRDDRGGFTSIWEYPNQNVSSSFFTSGANIISVIANDYGGLTYFDMELTGDVGDNGVSVPEPSTLALMGLGLLGIGFAKRKTLRA